MTRPSRGQCDAGHVIPPLSLSPSHLSPRILLMGAQGCFPHPHRHCCPCRGGRGKSLACPCHFLLPKHPLRSICSCSSYDHTTLGQGDAGAVPPPPPPTPPLLSAAPVPWKGASLCLPSVLSFMSPLSDLPPAPLPGQPLTCCPQGPAWGEERSLSLGPPSYDAPMPRLPSRSGGA